MYQITKKEALQRAKQDAINSLDFDLLEKYNLSETEVEFVINQTVKALENLVVGIRAV
jgi:hypothetical protein